MQINQNYEATGSSSLDFEENSILDSKVQLSTRKGEKRIKLENHHRAFFGGEVQYAGNLESTTRKRKKLREIDHRHSQPELAKLQPLTTVQGEQVHYQLTTTEIHQVEHKTQTTEYQQVEPIRFESQWTELQQAQTQWFMLQKVEVEPQWSDYLIEPPQATPVLLNPVETAQVQYAEIQEVTEIRVVKKIRIYEEIIEEVERNQE